MDKVCIDLLREFFGDFKDIIVLGSSSLEEIEVPFQIRAMQFFKFAENDLNSKYEHNLINSLSNIKRAIDCQMDTLLIAFGLYRKSKTEEWSFPRKLEVLNNLGIITPRILGKINQKRNFLEHEYRKPTKEEVEDALDVAALFLAYTKKFIQVWNDVELEKEDSSESFSLENHYAQNKIILKAYLDGKLRETIEITTNEGEYLEYLKFYVCALNKAR